MRQKIGCEIDLAARCVSTWSSYFSHLPTVGPEGAQVLARGTQVNPRAVRMAFTHTWKKNNNNTTKPKVGWPPSASSICLQTGCGRIEGVPRGKDFKRAPCLHRPFLTLSAGAERDGSGLVHGGRSASYITALLSPGWTAQFARLPIKAAELLWHPFSRAEASQG